MSIRAAALIAALGLLLAGCARENHGAGSEQCGAHPEQLVVRLDTDAEMEAVAARLRNDDRVDAVSTQTKMQAYERFKYVFANQPDLVKLARPEALPASVWAEVRGPLRAELADQLRSEFPDAQEVKTDACLPGAPPGRSSEAADHGVGQ